MYRLAWFTTARGPGSRALLKTVQEAIRTGEIPAGIEFVFCSRGPGEAEATDVTLGMVKEYGIPLVTFSCRQFKARHFTADRPEHGLPAWRLEYDREIIARLKDFSPDLCVLAGYMLVVGPEMCRRFNMLNLHPAAPWGPKGTWQEVIWQLIREGARESGVMMHLVTPDLDRGPCVSYCTFPIAGPEFDRYRAEFRTKSLDEIKATQGEEFPVFKLIRQHGLEREVILMTATVKAFAEGRARVTPDKQVVDALGKPIKRYDLTGEVNRKLA